MTSQPLFWGGEGIFISNDSLKTGNNMKLFILISKNMKMRLRPFLNSYDATIVKHQTYYYDYVFENKTKIYLFNFTTLGQEI